MEVKSVYCDISDYRWYNSSSREDYEDVEVMVEISIKLYYQDRKILI